MTQSRFHLHKKNKAVENEASARAIPKLSIPQARRARIVAWRTFRPVIHWHRRTPPPKVLLVYFGIIGALSLATSLSFLAGSKAAKTPVVPPPDPTWDLSSTTTAASFGGEPIPQGVVAEKARVATTARMIAAGESAKALLTAETAAMFAPDDPASWHDAGMVALGCGEKDKARKYFRKVIEITPFASASLFNLAQLEFEAGDYAGASRLLATFRKQDPHQRVAAFRAVMCALLLGQEAAPDPEALPEDSAAGLYARAAIALHGGDKEAASALIEKARATGNKNASRFEADLQLLGSK